MWKRTNDWYWCCYPSYQGWGWRKWKSDILTMHILRRQICILRSWWFYHYKIGFLSCMVSCFNYNQSFNKKTTISFTTTSTRAEKRIVLKLCKAKDQRIDSHINYLDRLLINNGIKFQVGWIPQFNYLDRSIINNRIKFQEIFYLLIGPNPRFPITSKSAWNFSTASHIFSFGSPTTTSVLTFIYKGPKKKRSKIINSPNQAIAQRN